MQFKCAILLSAESRLSAFVFANVAYQNYDTVWASM